MCTVRLQALLVSRASIRTTLKINFPLLLGGSAPFSNFHLQAVARGLAAGTVLGREKEGSGESCLCFPLVVGETLSGNLKKTAWVFTFRRPSCHFGVFTHPAVSQGC